MADIIHFGQICSNCKKRIATRLCDFPIGISRYIGHPPRSIMERSGNYQYAFYKVEMSHTITCNRPLCDQCAIKNGKEIDFCPSHKEVFKNV